MDSERQQLEDRLKQIDEALASGISSVTTDGTTTTVDLNQLRVERRELRSRLDTMRQPVAMTWDLRHGV